MREILPLLAAMLLASATGHAEGLFGTGNKLDASFCRENGLRQTVLYVDDSVLVSGQNGWLHNVYNKLAATLTPGERTTLVELSPTTGQSAERWSGCWPGYSPEETKRLAGEHYVFSTNPLANLKEQQGFFGRDLGIAVAAIEKTQARSAEQAMIDPNKPPRQSILRAITSDGARYSHAQQTIRVVLFSSLAENSDLGSVFTPAQPIDYGDKLGTFLRRSVFYVFGAGTNIDGDGHVQEPIRTFWTAALQSMAANVGGIGTDLNIPDIVPMAASSFDILLKDGGNTLTGRLSLLVSSEGNLVDSWLGVVRLRTSAVNGTYVCHGPAETPSCSLHATTIDGVVTMSPSEVITLSSHGTGALTGTIGVPGSSFNLPLAAVPAGS